MIRIAFVVKRGRDPKRGKMDETLKVLLFGDETGDFREPLQKLCDHQKGVIFLHFTARLNKVLRDEVRRQPGYVKKQIPPFTDVVDLVKQYLGSGSRNQILETTLACVFQLGSVIRCVFGFWRSQIGTQCNICA